ADRVRARRRATGRARALRRAARSGESGARASLELNLPGRRENEAKPRRRLERHEAEGRELESRDDRDADRGCVLARRLPDRRRDAEARGVGGRHIVEAGGAYEAAPADRLADRAER